MIGTKYKYALVDMSYILMRNMFAASRGKGIGEFTAGDVIRITIQTINKIPRDYGITADKFIFIYDKWDRDFGGYYRTYLLKGLYKSSREYVTQETVDRLKNDPNSTPEEILEAELKAYTNQVRFDAKWGMIRDLKKFGIPCLGLEGWEYDDLAWLSSCMLYGNSEKPSVIITKDSDLQYSITPEMDYFRIPTGGSEPKVITYNEMYKTIPDKLKGKLSLYQYKSYLDSLGEGHNDMTKTKKSGARAENVILKLLNGDYSDIVDIETFERQLSSFDISKFPRLNEAKEIIISQFSTVGKLGTLKEFKDFCEDYQIKGISDKYFTDFINRFDPKLFIEN